MTTDQLLRSDGQELTSPAGRRLTVITGAFPITARGAAMARVLLVDGTGPLYNRHCPLDLGAEVREATRQMNFFAGAASSGADREGAGCYR